MGLVDGTGIGRRVPGRVFGYTSKSAPWDFGEKLSMAAKIGPSVLESVVQTLNLKYIKIPESVLALLPSLPDLRTRCYTRQNDQNDERRVVGLITTNSLSTTDAMPEAPPCRARLVLVYVGVSSKKHGF